MFTLGSISNFDRVNFRPFPLRCAFALALLSARAAELPPAPDAAARHAFNTALGVLRDGNPDQFATALADFRARFPGDALLGDLRLEAALSRAHTAWKSARAEDVDAAADGLRDFIREFPRNDRMAEARLALAELAALGPEVDLDTARNQLRLARAAGPSPEAAERGDVLAIDLARQPGSADNPVVLADRFLKQHPQSRFVDSVRFARAEILLRHGMFDDAGIAWERLAVQQPNSPLVPAALFGAGEAALRQESGRSLERAASLFESVAGISPPGPLRAAARLGQARAKLRLGRAAVALIHCDEILRGEDGPPNEATRIGTALTRGEALLRLSSDDSARLPEAAAAFRAVTEAPSVPPELRRQSFAQLGDALRRTGDRLGAIAAWREAMRAPPAGGQDLIWFARAGFEAAQALQELERWREAAGVYEDLAQSGGWFRTEAEARLTQLRLAHFLWPEPR